MASHNHCLPNFPQSPSLPENYTCKELYTVKAGDTLYAISQAYSIPVAVLMQVNRILNPYSLKIGMKICIPGTSTETPTCSGIIHVVEEGDTLYMIAQQHKVPLAVILRANSNIDPYNLRIGMKICIPNFPGNGSPEPPETPPVRPTPPSKCPDGIPYQTQRGDTLTRILERFGLTYEELKKSNPTVDFNGSLETLVLCIPGLNEDQDCTMSSTYYIKAGDSLDSVSQKLLIVSDSLLMTNPKLTVTDFSVPGTKICIPK